MLDFILRNSKSFRNTAVLRVLYLAFVWSRLEYACVIWDPYYVKYKIALESVQRTFLRYLAYEQDGVYPIRGMPGFLLTDRFSVLELQIRRKYLCCMFLYFCKHH
ncbi:hypothetical protein HHI36_013369 [Cryptolaemus montrouzieri]|uniref:Uncharacterized protein n=1 Tax=Cryptolaemus montrouzieri TaxID=559131 RepID=A0ABD2NGZ4_9CUCU